MSVGIQDLVVRHYYNIGVLFVFSVCCLVTVCSTDNNVPAPVNVPSTGERGRIPKHYPPNESPLQPLTLFFNIYAHRLCAGGEKIIIIIRQFLRHCNMSESLQGRLQHDDQYTISVFCL